MGSCRRRRTQSNSTAISRRRVCKSGAPQLGNQQPPVRPPSSPLQYLMMHKGRIFGPCGDSLLHLAGDWDLENGKFYNLINATVSHHPPNDARDNNTRAAVSLNRALLFLYCSQTDRTASEYSSLARANATAQKVSSR